MQPQLNGWDEPRKRVTETRQKLSWNGKTLRFTLSWRKLQRGVIPDSLIRVDVLIRGDGDGRGEEPSSRPHIPIFMFWERKSSV
jgi:hypothetical protein